jgi:hypothetical protein
MKVFFFFFFRASKPNLVRVYMKCDYTHLNYNSLMSQKKMVMKGVIIMAFTKYNHCLYTHKDKKFRIKIVHDKVSIGGLSLFPRLLGQGDKAENFGRSSSYWNLLLLKFSTSSISAFFPDSFHFLSRFFPLSCPNPKWCLYFLLSCFFCLSPFCCNPKPSLIFYFVNISTFFLCFFCLR